MKAVFLLLSCFLARGAQAVSLPANMNTAEIRETVRTIGFGSTTRLLRDAESYPSWPGIKIGLEALVFPTGDLPSYGAANGSLSSLFLLPRLFISKGLFFNVDFIFSFFPSGIVNTLASTGGILKWTFLSERENHTGSVAAFVGYTKLNGLGGYSGSDWEFGLVGSRDLVRIKPYLGISLMLATAQIAHSLAPLYKASELAFHIFLGMEWELVANITAQVELFNLTPGASILFSQKF